MRGLRQRDPDPFIPHDAFPDPQIAYVNFVLGVSEFYISQAQCKTTYPTVRNVMAMVGKKHNILGGKELARRSITFVWNQQKSQLRIPNPQPKRVFTGIGGTLLRRHHTKQGHPSASVARAYLQLGDLALLVFQGFL